MALVSYTGKNVFGVGLASGEVIRLMPGINEVEESKLGLMKSHPLFESRIKLGLVAILGETIGKDGKRAVDELLGLIPKTFDVKYLKKLIDSDGRDKVVRAAETQLDRIKNPAKAKEEDADAHFQ